MGPGGRVNGLCYEWGREGECGDWLWVAELELGRGWYGMGSDGMGWDGMSWVWL